MIKSGTVNKCTCPMPTAFKHDNMHMLKHNQSYLSSLKIKYSRLIYTTSICNITCIELLQEGGNYYGLWICCMTVVCGCLCYGPRMTSLCL